MPKYSVYLKNEMGDLVKGEDFQSRVEALAALANWSIQGLKAGWSITIKSFTD